MRIRIMRRALLLVAVLLATAGSIHPQQPASPPPASESARQKAVSYTFVSPNTRENLTLRESLRLLNSTEEFELISATRKLASCLGLKPTILKTIGNWAGGSEHSTLFRVYTDQPTLRYLDARLGKRERQKSVLYFQQSAAGKSVMYILYPRRSRSGTSNLASISKTLDQSGVSSRTLVPGLRLSVIIYVVDLRDEAKKQVVSAAQRLRARLVVLKGTGGFIGDDSDRDKAQQIFDEVVEEYEAAHPQTGRRCSLKNQ
jgi:hypothetical protein